MLKKFDFLQKFIKITSVKSFCKSSLLIVRKECFPLKLKWRQDKYSIIFSISQVVDWRWLLSVAFWRHCTNYIVTFYDSMQKTSQKMETVILNQQFHILVQNSFLSIHWTENGISFTSFVKYFLQNTFSNSSINFKKVISWI